MSMKLGYTCSATLDLGALQRVQQTATSLSSCQLQSTLEKEEHLRYSGQALCRLHNCSEIKYTSPHCHACQTCTAAPFACRSAPASCNTLCSC